MAKPRVLLVDDDPAVLDALESTLLKEDYEILKAGDGEEAIRIIRSEPLDLVLLDYNMPKKNGRQVCLEVKKDILLQHIPIIIVTGMGELDDKIGGIDAGADDYVVKPFERKELQARIRMILRRTQRNLDANPLTRLPGNIAILNELSGRLESKNLLAVCYVDLDKFKAYNDTYGFEHGDEVIKETARIMIRSVQRFGDASDFIGHIGGDDFVIVTTPDKTDAICQAVIDDFDKTAPFFYNETDRKTGFILAKNRQGKEQRIPLLSVSIGVVTNEMRDIEHVVQIGEIGAELKHAAKRLEYSNFKKDKRRNV